MSGNSGLASRACSANSTASSYRSASNAAQPLHKRQMTTNRPSRAQADRLLKMRQGGLIIAGESITDAEISAGELRIGIEIKGTMQPASRLFVTTRK